MNPTIAAASLQNPSMTSSEPRIPMDLILQIIETTLEMTMLDVPPPSSRLEVEPWSVQLYKALERYQPSFESLYRQAVVKLAGVSSVFRQFVRGILRRDLERNETAVRDAFERQANLPFCRWPHWVDAFAYCRMLNEHDILPVEVIEAKRRRDAVQEVWWAMA